VRVEVGQTSRVPETWRARAVDGAPVGRLGLKAAPPLAVVTATPSMVLARRDPRGGIARVMCSASALSLVLAACVGDADSQQGSAGGDRGAGAAARVASSALHARHASAKPSIACEQCHEVVSGEYLRAKSWPCQQCHPAAPLGIHAAAPVDSPARECWSCHDFAASSARARACGSCHRDAQGHVPAISAHDPKTPSEDCDRCHRPHSEPALVATACDSCHREPVSGHDKPGIPITGCGSCHGYHEPAALASDRCTNCHRQSRAEVPVTATFAAGHVKCVTCHRQHRFVKTEVVGCRDGCHGNQVALAEDKVAEHRCVGCHDKHDVRGAALRSSCETTCHAGKVNPRHPKDAVSKTRCLGCHPAHRSAGAPVAVACSTCHKLAASDRAFHQGARTDGPACRDCHAPHDFEVDAKGSALCSSCHGPRPFKGTKTIRTHAKHDNCISCHGESARHNPAGPRVACTSCHVDKATGVMQGHATCVSCHDPHTTQQKVGCATCHAAQAAIARKDHKTCTSCHDPHAGKQKRTCASCHANEAATAPPPHQQCTSCHDQHSTLVKKRCGECHVDRTTGLHAAVSCDRCHRAHGPGKTASPPPCTSCHKDLPLMHQVPKHDDCKTCHRSHGGQPYRQRVACLSCHQDRTNHEPSAPTCIGCHSFGGNK
jgi:hypothetical protein